MSISSNRQGVTESGGWTTTISYRICGVALKFEVGAALTQLCGPRSCFLLLDDPTLEPSSVLAPPPLPSTNLYNLCINRIHSIKSGGAFHEHSPQLYSVAMGVPPAVRTTSRDQDGKLTTKYVSGGWKKVNIGMMKMYVAEVLSKRVVVQHTPLGGILDWDEVESSNPQTTNVSASQVPVSLPAPTRFIPQSATSMPSTRMPSQSTMLPTRFPGAPSR